LSFQVNDDYHQYEHTQGEILKREDELAATFVDKVLFNTSFLFLINVAMVSSFLMFLFFYQSVTR